MGKRILYLSGSAGLGHVTRDLGLATELRRQRSDLEILWLGGPTQSRVLCEAGESVLPEAADWEDETTVGEKSARGFGGNVTTWLRRVQGVWKHNFGVFLDVTRRHRFDLVVSDEAYEVSRPIRSHPALKPCPLVVIYDFLGLDAMTRNPIERIVVWVTNWQMARGYKRVPYPWDLLLFLGEFEDIPDESFGFLLPRRRDYARERCVCVGHIFPFDPADYADRGALRARLGYGPEPLLIGAIGGTAIGKDLLELCGRAFQLVRERQADLRMILVCGPRLDPRAIIVPEGVEVRGYVPRLFEHFAAADLVVTQGGGTSTSELAALRRPFLYFPLEEHFEQQIHVSRRLLRQGAGRRLSFAETSAESLSKAILSNLGVEADWAPIPVDGTRRAAEQILRLL